MVFFGHFLGGFYAGSDKLSFIWVPVTVGLLIFSFSSGYFTAIKYTGNFSKKNFYLGKLKRLGPNLLTIYVILLFLFIWQNQPGLWHWHTLINILGLNGFLQWFYIENASPYGRAMWFLTLLLIFYLFYPVIEKLSRNTLRIFSILFVLTAYILSFKVTYGHALWLTCCGFICGVCTGKNILFIPYGYSKIVSLISLAALLVLNLIVNTNELNFFLLLLFSLSFIFMILDLSLPDTLFRISAFFSASLLGIYLLHPYFLIIFTQIFVLDFFISVVIVLILSRIASQTAKKISLFF